MDTSSAFNDAVKSLENSFRVMPTEPWKSPLYLFTLVCQLPVAMARGFFGYCGAAVVGWILGLVITGLVGISEGFLPLLWSLAVVDGITGLFQPRLVGMAAAFLPLIWSFSAFWVPGGGWWWHRFHGGREASDYEEERIRGVIEHLGSRAEDAAEYLKVYIYDSQQFLTYARGRTLLVSVGLLESKFLKPAVAHELGHFRNMEARLIQALDRLVWGFPFPNIEERRETSREETKFKKLLRWLGGQPMLNFPPLRAGWAAYFRKREEAADAYAAELGQGMALVRYLTAYDKQREQPNPRLLFNYRDHVPTAQRIAALQRATMPLRKARRTG